MLRLHFLIADKMLLLLGGSIVLAMVLPVRGTAADYLDVASYVMIAGVFFCQGLKLSPAAFSAALRHGRLHSVILLITFVLYPFLGSVAAMSCRPYLPTLLADGIIFMTLVPSTLYSAVAFSGLAKGNIAAAVTAAALSNILGVLCTPLLVQLYLGGVDGAILPLETIYKVVMILVLPLLAGMAGRSVAEPWVRRHEKHMTFLDRSTVLVIVYGAFSSATVNQLWHRVHVVDLTMIAFLAVMLILVCAGVAYAVGRIMQLSKPDRVVILFGATQKSLMAGTPIAKLIFPDVSIGELILPLMIMHQLQLIIATILVPGWTKTPEKLPNRQ